jgi:hypothetical protein
MTIPSIVNWLLLIYNYSGQKLITIHIFLGIECLEIFRELKREHKMRTDSSRLHAKFYYFHFIIICPRSVLSISTKHFLIDPIPNLGMHKYRQTHITI